MRGTSREFDGPNDVRGTAIQENMDEKDVTLVGYEQELQLPDSVPTSTASRGISGHLLGHSGM